MFWKGKSRVREPSALTLLSGFWKAKTRQNCLCFRQDLWKKIVSFCKKCSRSEDSTWQALHLEIIIIGLWEMRAHGSPGGAWCPRVKGQGSPTVTPVMMPQVQCWIHFPAHNDCEYSFFFFLSGNAICDELTFILCFPKPLGQTHHFCKPFHVAEEPVWGWLSVCITKKLKGVNAEKWWKLWLQPFLESWPSW